MSKVIVKLGGVNGSGKTSVATALLDLTDAQSQPVSLPSGKETKVYNGLWEGVRVSVLGKYDNVCGGMDTISDKEDRFWLVEETAKVKGLNAAEVVFFEGLITGKTYGALGELSEQHHTLGTARWIYAFMDTPFDVAVDRVLARRAAAGNNAAFDPERTLRPTYNSCVRLEGQLRGTMSGRIPIDVDHVVMSLKHRQRPATLAKQVLKKALEVRGD